MLGFDKFDESKAMSSEKLETAERFLVESGHYNREQIPEWKSPIIASVPFYGSEEDAVKLSGELGIEIPRPMRATEQQIIAWKGATNAEQNQN